MQEMKIVEPPGRSKTPLVVRASFPRVFLSLGVFLEIVLLFCGSYLLADAILQPLDAGTFSIVGGGMFLGLAAVLLFFLAWPEKKRSISHREKHVEGILEVPLKGYGEPVSTRRESHWVTEGKKELLRPM
jgi:hypothetical protein